MIDTDAIRIQIDELRATITELRQDLADSETEVDRLTSENKELTEALKKECDDRDEMYDKADELGAEVAVWIGAYEEATKWKAHYSDRAIAWVQTCRRLTEQNKLMREVLKKIAKSGQDPFSRKWARDALTAIKGEPK